MNNIVFFGKSDAGKSTLAGYLISRFDTDFRFSRFIESMKHNNPNYKTRLAFSSIMNTNKDETVQSNRLNSKSLHLRKINLPFDSVTIIDTPGVENFRKQRERGMFYGNIGIFFMEIKDILEHSYDIETLAPIALWSKLEHKRMIFLLTKFDTKNYSEDMYNQALVEVQKICSCFGFDKKVTVIPTAIEVDRIEKLSKTELDEVDLGENICSRSNKMPWFTGRPLIEAIETEIHELDQRDEKEPLIFCITDQIDRPGSYTGKVWIIKMLSGILKVGQKICLAPVKDSAGNFSILTGEIKQLRSDLSRFDDLKEITTVRKGELCGMDIKNCYVDGHSARKNDFNAISSSCGFNFNADYVMSDKFTFEICEKDLDGFKKGRKMKLVWFGRSLSFVVEDIIVTEMVAEMLGKNKVTVLGHLENSQISLPFFQTVFPQSILIKGVHEDNLFKCNLIYIGDRVYKKD